MTCFWRHKWGKWKITEEGSMRRMIDGKDRIVGSYKIQQRKCENCDYTDIKSIIALF